MSRLEFSDDSEKLNLLNKQELDELDRSFSLNALRVLASRYLLRDANGKIIETPKQCFERIAILIGISDILHDERFFAKNGNYQNALNPDLAEKLVYEMKPTISIGKFKFNRYHIEALVRLFLHLARAKQMRLNLYDVLYRLTTGEFDSYENNIQRYFDLMVSKDFLPNTPTIMNAGAQLGQLSACFVLDIDDNLESIMQTAKNTAFIFKTGGGVGINYSNLRAENSMVASTLGVASGPVSFMGIIDKVTDVIKQGGKRRGANMGILDLKHPDIRKFVTAKRTKGVLENFNISVGMWEKPDPEDPLFNLIVESAHASAEPGVIFFDRVNEHNPLRKARGYPLRATNPCGEQSLYPFESCNLGSINLANFVENENFDWNRYVQTIRDCTRFLDNVVDVNKYPLPQIEAAAFETRRIGLGIMGLSDALIKMRIQYNSEKGYEFMERLAETLTLESMKESISIAERRGSFGLYEQSGYKDGLIPVAGCYNDCVSPWWVDVIEAAKTKGIRNSFCTTVAPTGSLSMIADTSSGIEPTFALAFEKRVAVGRYFYKNKYLQEWLANGGNDIDYIWQNIVENHGSLSKAPVAPWVKNVFVTTFDLTPAEHIRAQAVWQKWINNAISKTINIPNSATVNDVKSAYLLAYESGLKGITIYRDGSRHEQVLHA